MPWLILLLVLLALLFGPGWWVQRVMRRYAEPADRYPGTGAQLARKLLDWLGMEHVAVERTDRGDHYDPTSRTVRLTPDHHDGSSLTAITVAAHEVGHAIQDFDGYRPLKLRTRLATVSAFLTRAGGWLLVGAPILAIALRNPALARLGLLAGVAGILFSALLHVLTLPVEFDASFGRAMPLLEKGRILHEPDYPHARRILRAAALTYVAQALFGVVTAWRWLRLPG